MEVRPGARPDRVASWSTIRASGIAATSRVRPDLVPHGQRSQDDNSTRLSSNGATGPTENMVRATGWGRPGRDGATWPPDPRSLWRRRGPRTGLGRRRHFPPPSTFRVRRETRTSWRPSGLRGTVRGPRGASGRPEGVQWGSTGLGGGSETTADEVSRAGPDTHTSSSKVLVLGRGASSETVDRTDGRRLVRLLRGDNTPYTFRVRSDTPEPAQSRERPGRRETLPVSSTD